MASDAPRPLAGSSVPALRIYRRALGALDWVAERMIIVIMALMLTIVSAQVFLRYALNRSIDWADETATLCFVWTVFLALPLALRNGGHIVMEMLLTRVTTATRDRLYRVMSVASAGMMLLIAREAFVLTLENWDEVIPVLNLSGGLYYLPVALGTLHSAFRCLELVVSGEPAVQDIIE